MAMDRVYITTAVLEQRAENDLLNKTWSKDRREVNGVLNIHSSIILPALCFNGVTKVTLKYML